MLKYYLRTGIQAIRYNRIYSFVNIFGLTLGLCACMLVATVVIDDLSYDRQWSRSNDLYRIISVNKMGEGLYEKSSQSFAGLGPELKKDFPQVESAGTLINESLRLKFDERQSSGVELTSLRADTSVWSMLDIKVVSGNPRQFVEGQRNLLISESMRNKYFAGKNPVGKIIYDLSASDEKPGAYLITGVMKDLRSNTHLRADMMQLTRNGIEPLSHEDEGFFRTQYLLMRPGTDIKKFTEVVNKWYADYVTKGARYTFEFQPVKDVYLHSDFNQYQAVKGSIRNIYIFSGAALLLLLIACINFINLNTAKTVTRLRETGVRKVLGAGSTQIVYQFLTESVLYFTISSGLAIFLYWISLPTVEHYLGRALEFTFMSRFALMGMAIAVILLVSLLTGIYPAWILSRFELVGALKGKINRTGNAGQNGLMKTLVVIQFSLSIIVLLAMIIVNQQVRFMEKADLGYNPKGLLSIGRITWDGKSDAFKNELRKIPGVEQFSITSFIPSIGPGFMSREMQDPNNTNHKITLWYITGDLNLAQTLGLRLTRGRLFNDKMGTDAANLDSSENIIHQHSIITAGTAKMLHIKALNEGLKDVWTEPVGIVEDFHNESLRQPLGPTFILAETKPYYEGMLIRVKPGSEKQVMTSIEKLWKIIFPSKLLETNWVEGQLNSQYAEEGKLQQLFAFFSLLSMLLAAMGIFGLILHAAGLRVKEIGVRKVLGATIGSIVRLLSLDYLKLVLIAILIASPLSWWLMNKWLEDFAYRIHIVWWTFGLAGMIALLIAFATVGTQALKSAMANPVKSLRSE